MRRIQFVEENYYHVMNRGVDGRDIFDNHVDRLRFLHLLHTLKTRRDGSELVKVAAYCLMNNHFHILLKPTCKNGVSAYLHRVSVGYVMYYNRENNRKGRLFQNTFHAVPIEGDAHFWHITRYIHLNPLETIYPGWETRGSKNKSEALAFLKRYPWSSYQRYIALRNDPLVDDFTFVDAFNGPSDYEKFMQEWIKQD